MNILMLTSVYPQPDDGDYTTTATVEYFCKEWSRQGHNLIVIHNNSIFLKLLYYIPRGLKIYLEQKMQIQIPSKESIADIDRIDGNIKIYRRAMFKLWPHTAFMNSVISKQGQEILKIIYSNNFKPDYIIGHWANPQLQLIDWLKKHLKGNYKTALVFHNDCSFRDVQAYSMFKYISSIDAIGCRNKKFGKDIKTNLKLEKIPFICYSGLPNNIVDKTNIDDIISTKSRHTIICVGRLVKYKRIDLIISALAKYTYKVKTKLEIIGDGSEKDYLRDLILAKNLRNQVSMISNITRDEVFTHLKKSECFTLLSENETFGMVYLEAMLMGCITIATKGCAVDGIIINGVNGFLCEAGNEKELQDIYEKIYSMTDEDRYSMMKKAHESAKEYSDYAVASKYLNDIDKY